MPDGDDKLQADLRIRDMVNLRNVFQPNVNLILQRHDVVAGEYFHFHSATLVSSA